MNVRNKNPKGRGIFKVSNTLDNRSNPSYPSTASGGVFETNKKGVWALSYTAKIILTLVVTALLLLMVRELGHSMTQGYNKQLCKESVILNSKIKMPVVGATHFDIDCPTRYVTIDTDDVISEIWKEKESKDSVLCKGKIDDELKGTRKGVKTDSEESLSCFKENINERIANLLYDCWDQFGRGRLNIFSETSQERNCVICSRIEFTDKAKEALNRVDDEELQFDNYLRNHRPLLHEISYYEFLMDELDAVYSPYYEYYPEEVYAVVYRIKYSSKIKEIAGQAVNLVYCSGKWGLSFLGADPCDINSWAKDQLTSGELEVSTVNEFLPYSEIKDRCDLLK